MSMTLHMVEQDYHDHTLYVTDDGLFVAKNDQGELVAQASSLPALKNKVTAPVRVNIPALILSPDRLEKITIATVSGTGVYYVSSRSGRRHKLYCDEALRLPDAEREAEYKRLEGAIDAAEQALRTYVNKWPRLTRAKLRELARKAKEADATQNKTRQPTS